jgi:hypothetical protein
MGGPCSGGGGGIGPAGIGLGKPGMGPGANPFGITFGFGAIGIGGTMVFGGKGGTPLYTGGFGIKGLGGTPGGTGSTFPPLFCTTTSLLSFTELSSFIYTVGGLTFKHLASDGYTCPDIHLSCAPTSTQARDPLYSPVKHHPCLFPVNDA